jgi:hypothetical protein
MNFTQKIIVSEKAKSFLISREAVDSLFDNLNVSDYSNFEFDFENVEFMSRSYADQFHKAQSTFEHKHNKRIHIVNANTKIINMLQAVAQTQHATKRKFEQVPIFRFSKAEMLSDYFFSI